jgi:hydroxymethylglutaryl-CoA synthase
LANARSIEPEKLEKGLATQNDIARCSRCCSFGANALTKLIVDHNIDLTDIARIYVGTESAIDSSKPISSFLVALMEQKFMQIH